VKLTNHDEEMEGVPFGLVGGGVWGGLEFRKSVGHKMHI
jgi:hypothetical protein